MPAVVRGLVFDQDDDGDVDLIDYAGFVECFGGPLGSVEPPCDVFD